ncbi:MAG TPA: ABC transporter substrate-binding protein [Ktedonobacterales bacterium]|nr:ABC transporter substrate-binding protein [Ktedonobacterales bacterium]
MSLSSLVAGCGIGGPTNHKVTLLAIFPTTGASGAMGQSMSQAVDLAVKQNATLGDGYTLAVAHVNEASVTVGPDTAQAVTHADVLGAVGPMSSQAAIAILPALAQAGVVTISPTAMLPGLTKADQAAAEGVSFGQSHPQGKPIAFFRMTSDDNAAATAAADLALASPKAHGLGSHAVFVVDDGTASGKAQSATFQAEVKAQHGEIAGTHSVTQGDVISVQMAVSAIIGAEPDSVFFAGEPGMAAELRRTLTQTGAPSVTVLVAGAAADDPSWSDMVGGAVLSGFTTGLLPAQDPSKLASAQGFVTAYQRAYPGGAVTPESLLAYDAAMDEISAIKSLLAAKKTPTRAATLATVAAARYPGVTGKIAFDKNGDPVAPPGFAVYTCDSKGAWTYQTSLGGAAAG